MGAIRKLKRILEQNIRDISKDVSAFVREPGRDFTRTRKLGFEDVMRFIISMGGQSINKELYAYSIANDRTEDIPSASAFTQQRQKILPEAFYEVFRAFNRCTQHMDRKMNEWHGCRVLAVDGTDVNLPYNETSKTFVVNKGKKGFNQAHVTALYDITNRVYLDAIIEPKTKYNESRSSGIMAVRTLSGGKNILMGDRGTISLNLIKTMMNNKLSFLFRVKSDWIKEIAAMPFQTIDTHVVLHIATSAPMYRKLIIPGDQPMR